MKYQEFVEQVVIDIRKYLPMKLQNAKIETARVEKLQNAGYYGISVQPETGRIGVSFDLQPFYQSYLENMDFEDELLTIAQVIRNGLKNPPVFSIGEMNNYAVMKETLMIQLVPIEGNELMLATIPHVKWKDLAIIYRFTSDCEQEGIATMLITNTLLAQYGITKEQLHEDALTYAPINFPFCIRDLNEILAGGSEEFAKQPSSTKSQLLVASCYPASNGAGCIFYPGFLQQAAERIGGSFFVLPSSVHEVILVPDDGSIDYQALLKSVAEVNMREVKQSDFLANNVYHYDAKLEVFETIQEYADRQLMKKGLVI